MEEYFLFQDADDDAHIDSNQNYIKGKVVFMIKIIQTKATKNNN